MKALSIVEPENNVCARTSLCVHKPATSCGYLRVTNLALNYSAGARTSLLLKIETARTSLWQAVRFTRTSWRLILKPREGEKSRVTRQEVTITIFLNRVIVSCCLQVLQSRHVH